MTSNRHNQSGIAGGDPSPHGIPGIAILPLRLFLGATFLYASYQKLTDPGFFKTGSPTYIGTQIAGFSHGTPLGGVLAIAAQHAVLVGSLTILTEFTIGCLTLAGFFTRGAALTGLFLNLTFFLSASWLVYPYFLGSDIVFVAAWMTIIFTGPGEYALDFRVGQALAEHQRRSGVQLNTLGFAFVTVLFGPPVSRDLQNAVESDPVNKKSEPSHKKAASLLTRREAGLGILAAMFLFLLGIAPRKWSSGVTGAANPTGHVPSTPAPDTSPNKLPTGIPAGAQKITNTNQLPENNWTPFTDANNGNPALLVHNTDNKIVCFSAICTHQGCTVAYHPELNPPIILCPCHGSEYDPNNAAAVLRPAIPGQPQAPLTSLPIKIAGNGDIYLV